MSQFLLREYFELCEGGVCEDLLTEQEKREIKNGAFYLTGVMQRADAKNGNGRVYPENVLRREVENYKKLVAENRALGELDHPDESVINLKNASHIVTEIWWNGKDVMGKVKVLTTPSGQILKSLVESGVKLGISSRGLGSVKEKAGLTYVEDDFQLICFDFVSEPSTVGAFMGLSESKKAPNIFNKSDKINRLLNDIIGE
jgi:Prohead core protein serine protease